ncbi:MAG: oligosaccharide flippase family protein, partial [Alphaproteobacteria bacterium]|nr:oligosaccharide flippase family protein [Alphaproteobacteria bacterium]
SVYGVATLQAVTLAVVLVLIAPVVAGWANEPRAAEPVRMLALYALAIAAHTTLGGHMMRRMQYGRFSATLLIQNVVNAGTTIGLALAGFSYMSLVWGAIAGGSASSLAALWLQRRDLAVRPTLARWRDIWRFGWHVLVANLILNICAKLPDILLSRLAGVTATGLYNRASGLVDVFSNTVIGSFTRVMSSLFAQHRRETGGFRYAYLRMARISTGLLWPAYAGLAVLASPVIGLVYGETWAAAAPVLSLLCIAAIINTSLLGRGEILITGGDVSKLPRIESLRGIAGVAMFAAAAGQFGMVAAAATRIVDAVIAVALYLPHVYRNANVRASEAPGLYAPSLFVTLAAAAPPVAIMAWHGWPVLLPPLWLLAAIVAGGITWLAAVTLAHGELRHEMGRVIDRVRQRLNSAVDETPGGA